MTITNPDPLFSATNLEDYTGIPAGTWRYYVSTGKGPHSFKLGGKRVWRKSTVDAWIAAAEGVSA